MKRLMKIILISSGILLLAFIAIQIYTMSVQKGIETYPYTVEKKFEHFEIRQYEASLFTSVQLTSSEYEEASSRGFNMLAGYIFGGNDRNEKIAMTSPVSMSLTDSITMMFMIPKSIKKEDLPQPNQSSIEFKEEPAKRVAAISFGGWASSEKIDKYKLELIEFLEASETKHSDRFFFLGYNAPYEMVGRKNEIIVELD